MIERASMEGSEVRHLTDEQSARALAIFFKVFVS